MSDSPDSPRAKFVAYYRVSTARQGQSGLGLEAQRSAVIALAASRRAEIVGEYTEVQSGTSTARRSELRKALDQARRDGAVLVVARLDRLARDAAFVLGLREANVEFMACDFPEANRLVVTILAAVAEYEAKLCSERTRAGLAAAKARGVVLGGARPHAADQIKRMHKATRDAARARRKPLVPIVRAAFEFADENASRAAQMLNAGGTPTPSGRGQWHANSVIGFLAHDDAPPTRPPTIREDQP